MHAHGFLESKGQLKIYIEPFESLPRWWINSTSVLFGNVGEHVPCSSCIKPIRESVGQEQDREMRHEDNVLPHCHRCVIINVSLDGALLEYEGVNDLVHQKGRSWNYETACWDNSHTRLLRTDFNVKEVTTCCILCIQCVYWHVRWIDSNPAIVWGAITAGQEELCTRSQRD